MAPLMSAPFVLLARLIASEMIMKASYAGGADHVGLDLEALLALIAPVHLMCQCPHPRRKEAVTLALEFTMIVHVREAPEHAPDQPENTEPPAGVAVRVTFVPAGKAVPVGLVETVPVPVPVLAMVRV
jgi:hypothetical protein